jgi:hypothetical protein
MGGKELLDLIGLKERRGIWRTLTQLAMQTVLVLHTQHLNCLDRNWLRYDVISGTNYFNSCRNKLSSIKCKAFEIGDNYLECKLKLRLESQTNFKDTSKSMNIIISQ